MSVNINLVDKRNPDDSKKVKVKKVKGISFAVLAITALLALLIFAIDYRFSASYVQKQQAELLNELSQHEKTSAKIFIVNSKLTDISTILTQRKKYNVVTSKIASKNAGTVDVDEFLIDETGIKMVVSSGSLSSIDQFLNSMITLVDEKVISSILLENLSFVSGNYIVELIML